MTQENWTKISLKNKTNNKNYLRKKKKERATGTDIEHRVLAKCFLCSSTFPGGYNQAISLEFLSPLCRVSAIIIWCCLLVGDCRIYSYSTCSRFRLKVYSKLVVYKLIGITWTVIDQQCMALILEAASQATNVSFLILYFGPTKALNIYQTNVIWRYVTQDWNKI